MKPQTVLEIPERKASIRRFKAETTAAYFAARAKKTGAKIVSDGFAGTTRVSQAFAQIGYKIVCSGVSARLKTFGLCYLKNEKNENYHQK